VCREKYSVSTNFVKHTNNLVFVFGELKIGALLFPFMFYFSFGLFILELYNKDNSTYGHCLQGLGQIFGESNMKGIFTINTNVRMILQGFEFDGSNLSKPNNFISIFMICNVQAFLRI
jgi:hypothetical protein